MSTAREELESYIAKFEQSENNFVESRLSRQLSPSVTSVELTNRPLGTPSKYRSIRSSSKSQTIKNNAVGKKSQIIATINNQLKSTSEATINEEKFGDLSSQLDHYIRKLQNRLSIRSYQWKQLQNLFEADLDWENEFGIAQQNFLLNKQQINEGEFQAMLFGEERTTEVEESVQHNKMNVAAHELNDITDYDIEHTEKKAHFRRIQHSLHQLAHEMEMSSMDKRIKYISKQPNTSTMKVSNDNSSPTQLLETYILSHDSFIPKNNQDQHNGTMNDTIRLVQEKKRGQLAERVNLKLPEWKNSSTNINTKTNNESFSIFDVVDSDFSQHIHGHLNKGCENNSSIFSTPEKSAHGNWSSNPKTPNMPPNFT